MRAQKMADTDVALFGFHYLVYHFISCVLISEKVQALTTCPVADDNGQDELLSKKIIS